MSEIKLKPCPFCGATGEELMMFCDPSEGADNSAPSRRVQCARCNIEAPFYDTERAAVEAWNTRALPKAQAVAFAYPIPLRNAAKSLIGTAVRLFPRQADGMVALYEHPAPQVSADVVRASRYLLWAYDKGFVADSKEAWEALRAALRTTQSPAVQTDGEREDAVWNDVERDALIAIIAGAQSLADSFHDQTLPAPQELRRAIPIATAILKRQSAAGKGGE